MADPENSTNPRPEETKEPTSVPAPTDSRQGEPAAGSKADTPAKPAKKAAKQKKEQPAPATAAASENLSLSADVEKPKVVKAKGSKNIHSGIAHVLSTFNNTIVTITDMKGNVIGWSSAGKVGFKTGDGPWAERSGSLGKRTWSRTRIRGARVAGSGARSHCYPRCYSCAPQRLSPAKTTPRLILSTNNSQLSKMARYTGPKTRVSRRYGVPIFGSSKALERKNYPPGMHGPRGSRRKQSEYAIALGEKQKLRYQYGLLERQFRRIFEKALQKRGVTGETLLQLLETRIDNVVYRLGLANTRNAARQLVSHGHVLVNGRGVNVASYNVKAGDEIAIKDKPKSRQLVLRNLDLTQIVPVPDWLTVDRDALSGKVTRIPSREEIQPIVNEQLIVELYSR